jgi:hypothetical protein
MVSDQNELLFILVADFRHQPVGRFQEGTQGSQGLEVFVIELTFQNDRVGRNSPQQGINHFLPVNSVPSGSFALGIGMSVRRAFKITRQIAGMDLRLVLLVASLQVRNDPHSSAIAV